jgi:hypothetical protein
VTKKEPLIWEFRKAVIGHEIGGAFVPTPEPEE